jgi:hypothetical protein
VPLMLLARPLEEQSRHTKELQEHQKTVGQQKKRADQEEKEERALLTPATNKYDPVLAAYIAEAVVKHDFHFSEAFIHQLIEVIEFVLGSVSNTASYLRLWALSLAHSQLAKVFYQKTVGAGLQAGSIPGVSTFQLFRFSLDSFYLPRYPSSCSCLWTSWSASSTISGCTGSSFKINSTRAKATGSRP